MNSIPSIGISTGSFFPLLQTEESLKTIADNGIEHLELALQASTERDIKYIYKIKEIIESRNLSVLGIHPRIFGYEHLLFSPYVRQREEALDTFYSYLNVCLELKCNNLIFHMVNNGPESNDLKIIEYTNSLAVIARGYNVSISVENCNYGVFSSINKINKLSSLLHPSIRFILDFKCAWKVEETPLSLLEAMGNRYLYSHVSSYSNSKYGINIKETIAAHDEFFCSSLYSNLSTNQKKLIIETQWSSSIEEVMQSHNAVKKYFTNERYLDV